MEGKSNLPLITIQILNWNRAKDTILAIESAMRQTYENIEIVIIDNGSTDDSVRMIKRHYPQLSLIQLNRNYGCPGGRNKGIPYCNGDYIFYLDNDGELHKDALMNSYNTIISKSNIGVVTGIVYEYREKTEIDTSCKIRNYKKYSFNNFQGGICLHDKRIYSKVGTYPDHFMYGAEEYYLSLKLFDHSFEIVKDESVVLWHIRSNTARNRSLELKNAYFNKLYVAVSLYPFLSALKFIIYFIPAYMYFAKKEGCLKEFLKSYTSNLIKNISKGFRNRDPVKKETFIKFRKFKPIVL